MADMNHEHDHDCSCGCDQCEDHCDITESTVTLTLDDDSEVECAVLTVFPAGEREYIALLPLDENGENQDGEVFLYRFSENGEEGPSLENIEDDDEYEMAADAFDEMLDEAQFDEEEPEA